MRCQHDAVLFKKFISDSSWLNEVDCLVCSHRRPLMLKHKTNSFTDDQQQPMLGQTHMLS